MRLGLDFDNTLISYDRAFYVLARKRGLIPDEVAPTKLAVRDHLRLVGREDDWTELQGHVYGPGIVEAEPFPGALEFLVRCARAGLESAIVSHKTRRPYRGPAYDLRGAALGWLEARGFLGPETGLDRDRVFFEDAKEAKTARVAALSCDAFIDDLPEFLELSGFPHGMVKILFVPHGAHPAGPASDLATDLVRVASFEEAWLVTRRLAGGGRP